MSVTLAAALARPWRDRQLTELRESHDIVRAAVAPILTCTEVSHAPKLRPTSVSVPPPRGAELTSPYSGPQVSEVVAVAVYLYVRGELREVLLVVLEVTLE